MLVCIDVSFQVGFDFDKVPSRKVCICFQLTSI